MPLHSESTVHVFTTNPSKAPFKTRQFSSNYQTNHPPLCHHLSNPFIANMAKPIPGQWALAVNSHPDTFWQNERKNFAAVDPSSPSWNLLFDPCSISLPDSFFQLIPAACPNHFATGDVYTLLSILRSAPVDADWILVNQDLAGFFTSIDQDRFVRSWFMLLDFLRPKMNVSDDEAFSVYPGNPTIRVTSSRTYLSSSQCHSQDLSSKMSQN